jgi:Zn-dependent protease with chaperone function
MAVAVVIALAGLGLLLAVEFAFAALIAITFVFYTPVFGAGAFVLVGILVVGVLCWQGLARVAQNVQSPPTVREHWRVFAGLAAVGIGLFVGHATVTGAGIDRWPLSLALGAVGTVGYTGWLAVEEFRSAGTVCEELKAEYRVTSDDNLESVVERRVSRLAAQANCPVPEIRIGGNELPQAATVGYRPSESTLVVSRGLIERLDDRELDAVLAHELAHVLNRDAAVLTALSMPRSKALVLAERAGFVGILAGIPVYVANALSVPVVARYREYVADHAAAELTGDPAALASALATLDEAHATAETDLRAVDAGGAFGIVPPPWRERHVLDGAIRFVRRRIFGTHPPTERRIERLRSRID